MERFLPLAWACVAMAALTFVVAVRLLHARITEMREKKIRPQQFATSRDAQQMESLRIADNLRNLHEAPVLFYAVCILLMVTGHVSAFFVACAWLYVALRCVHSWIHCTYNRVRHRFYAFGASFAVLAAMWVGFALALLR